MVDLDLCSSGPAAVVVADNDPIVRGVVRALLMKIGRSVEVAATSDEALALVDPDRHCLVILDLDMPGEGGLAVCRALRERHGAAAPVIGILTAHTDAATRTRCREAGAALFVEKPFNPASLLRELSAWLPAAGGDTAGLQDVLLRDRGLAIQDQATSRRG